MSVVPLSRRVHVRAPGKINVYFGAGIPGEDDYHQVGSVYQAVSLYEDVWAEDSEGFTVSVDGSVDVSDVPTDDRNLAVRAARFVARAAGERRGVHLHITKNVPVAGGMGGGSADAAASLLACNELWGAELGSAKLHELAAELGADVPFALMGGTAVGTGRGDELSPALARGRIDWVIVPGSGLSTPEVYRRLDELREPDWGEESDVDEPYVEPELLQALRVGNAMELAEFVHNDLEWAAVDLRPELADILKLGEKAGALAGIVSGSGPTLAFLARSAPSAIDLQVTLSAAGHQALHVHGPVPGARVISDVSNA